MQRISAALLVAVLLFAALPHEAVFAATPAASAPAVPTATTVIPKAVPTATTVPTVIPKATSPTATPTVLPTVGPTVPSAPPASPTTPPSPTATTPPPVTTAAAPTAIPVGAATPEPATKQSAPVVRTITPNNGTTAGDATIKIVGSNFAPNLTVKFGDVPVPHVALIGTTELSVQTPGHAAGAVTVTVTNSDEQFGALANGYTFIAPAKPTPTPGVIPTPTDAPTASFASPTPALPPPTAPTATPKPTVTALPPTPTTAPTTTPNPTATATATPTSVAPAITSISPDSGSTVGGTSVTIHGTGFAVDATASFDGIAAANLTIVNPTTLTTTAPAHLAGVVAITVTTSAGSATKSSAFTYLAPPPSIAAITPNEGPITGGTRVTITGTDLTKAAVTFDGVAGTVIENSTLGTSVTFVSSTSIQVTTPASAATGAVSVIATNPDGQTGAKATAFTYGAPTVSIVSPASGSTVGGTAVTITGSNFASGATVTFGGAAATGVVVVSSTSITATTPAGSAGAANVVVTNTDGTTGTRVGGFTYIAVPTVTSLSPNGGTTNGGTSVTITGTNFASGATVAIGGATATSVTVTNSTTITATTPAHAAGAVDVVVTNPDTQSDTLTGGFTFVGILTITAQPADFSYSATLTGSPVTRTASFAVGVNDSTGSGAGWNLQASTGPLTKGADTIPAANHTITGAIATGVTGTAPTNSVVYPLPIPTGAGKIYNAATNTGTGQATPTFNTQLVVPADTAAGTYTATLTVTIAAGP